MGKINRPPQGLQSLLGSVNFGVNPAELFETVRPTVDLFPFWAQQQLRFDQQIATAAGYGSLVETTVPEGEIWGIISVGYRTEVNTAGSDDFICFIGLSQNLVGTTYYLVHAQETQNLNVGIQTGQYNGIVWQPDQLVWLPSGTVIRGIFQGSNNTSKDHILDTVYYQLQV